MATNRYEYKIRGKLEEHQIEYDFTRYEVKAVQCPVCGKRARPVKAAHGKVAFKHAALFKETTYCDPEANRDLLIGIARGAV